ncbi:hypothetical protein MMC22_003311 [Lobaria immixta]|nr:hypothetical protein [Lobaria immixta]
MSGTITITLDPTCEEGFGEDYRENYEADFTEWMNLHRNWTTEVVHGNNRTQETFVFDEALIMWMNLHRTWTMEVVRGSNRRQETFVFDEALIMNNLHQSTSKIDGNTSAHATVRLSTPALRATTSWYTLHWHPTADSTVLPRPYSEQQRLAKKKEVGSQGEETGERPGKEGRSRGESTRQCRWKSGLRIPKHARVSALVYAAHQYTIELDRALEELETQELALQSAQEVYQVQHEKNMEASFVTTSSSQVPRNGDADQEMAEKERKRETDARELMRE